MKRDHTHRYRPILQGACSAERRGEAMEQRLRPGMQSDHNATVLSGKEKSEEEEDSKRDESKSEEEQE